MGKKCKYDAVCTLAKLFECEVQVMKKIQKQIARYHAKVANKAVDLQIAQLFQALDMRNNGRLTRKQIKGILSTHGKHIQHSIQNRDGFVPEGDINSIMRRMDADGDEEVSFSDFFASLLPYFIYGDLRMAKTSKSIASVAESKSKQAAREVLSLKLGRARSANTSG